MNNSLRYFFLIILYAACVSGCGRQVSTLVQTTSIYTDSTLAYIKVDSTWQTDRYLDSMISAYKGRMEATMDVVIGYTQKPLTKAQPEGTLGYLAVDALYDFVKEQDTQVAVAVINHNGLRINYISPGPITIGNVYGIMPFDNSIVVLEVPGTVLKIWCQHMAGLGGWPIKGVTYDLKDKKAEHVLVAGQPVNDHFVYRVATTDYLANGGDKCEFLKPLKRYQYNKFHRDCMIDYLKKLTAANDSLNYTLEYRIKGYE